MSDESLIIGGGFAGLAAGVALAGAGRRVRLLEQSRHLGGRARSFRDAATGSVLDNGQHILMGCYHRTLNFLETIGTLDRVRFQPQMTVHFLERGERRSVLRCPGLPSPWHLLGGVLVSNAFSWREKRDVLKLGRALQRGRREAQGSSGASHGSNSIERMTVEDWLQSLGQSERVRRNFWDLLCIAAMNEDPKIASAAIFARVLGLAMFQSPADSRIGVPIAGLSDCYTDAAASYIHARGGQVELGKGVRAVLSSGGTVKGVRLADGEVIEAKEVVSASPWYMLARILPVEIARHPFFAGIKALRPAPIISIYLWFDRPVTDLDFVGLRGTTIQWLFNKSSILSGSECGPSASKLSYVSLVISGAHDHISRTQADLASTAINELAELMPEIRAAKLLRSLVIKEPFATFSPVAGVEPLRPPSRTPVRGLYLAGDWTATGLPATIEGAVESGYTAAEAILAGS
jgi:squalene-associated FAD-dependent desaturase